MPLLKTRDKKDVFVLSRRLEAPGAAYVLSEANVLVLHYFGARLLFRIRYRNPGPRECP